MVNAEGRARLAVFSLLPAAGAGGAGEATSQSMAPPPLALATELSTRFSCAAFSEGFACLINAHSTFSPSLGTVLSELAKSIEQNHQIEQVEHWKNC